MALAINKLILIIHNNHCNFQINSLMTYTVRTKKLLIHPNITGNTTVDQYKNNYYINGNIVFNFKKSPNNVSVIIIIECKLMYIYCYKKSKIQFIVLQLNCKRILCGNFSISVLQ